MIATRMRLVGGPLCGSEIAPSTHGFIFVQPSERGPRVFREAKAGRLLYGRQGGSYVYAGHTHALCEGCGAVAALRDTRGACHWCGGTLRRLPARH